MARISTYINDKTISGEDLLTGSDYKGINNYETKTFKIKDLTDYIQGQISISPSNSTLKTNGGIVNEVIDGTNSLAIDLSATNITGQLANSDLVNSSITINGTAVSLGGTITIGEVTGVTAGTYLNGGGTEGTVTVNHDTTSRTDTTSTATPAYGATFTVIDTLTTNTTGHVTAANVKTVTIPASDDTTYTIEAVDSTNDSIIRLIGTDSTTDDIKLIAGSNVTLSTSEANDTITISSQAFGTVFTVNTESAMVSATSTGGDIVIRTDISKTFIHNGGSAGTVADFSELQFSGINTLALTAGDGIDLSRTTVTNTDNDVTVTNTLATSLKRGGVKIGYTTDANNRNYAIQLDSEKMYVNVPWTDANDNTFRTIEVDSNGDGSVNETLGATETLRFKKGANITLAEDAGEITISSANTEYNVVNSSAAGLAPQLPAADGGKFLKADGTYAVPAYTTNTNTQNTYSINIPANTTKFRLSGTISGATDTTDDIEFVGSGATTVTRTDENKFTISSTDNNDNTQNTTELSFVAELDEADPPAATGNIILRNTISGASSSTDDIKLNAGSNITLTRDDEHNITISETTTYAHPTHPGDDIDIDTNALTGATVISDLDFNITTDTLGHVTDANAEIATRDLSLADLGYTGETDANNYSLPTATANALGGVKVGTNLSIVSGVLSADEQTANDFTNALKTKLDNIEASATADQTAAEIQTLVGTGNEKFVPAAGNAGEFLKHDGTFGTPSYTTNTNYYLDGITKGTGDDVNKLTFSVNGANNQEYTFGSNAFNSTTIPTDNNQLANGAGYTTNTGTTTASNTQTFTNKSGNISQWTNDSGYLTSYSETDTLANVTGRGASTTTDTTFNSHLTIGGTGHWLYIVPNTANTNPTHVHGMAMGWNYSGGSRESNIIFAAGSDANASQEADAQIRFSYKPVSGSISTVAKLWSGGNMNIAGYLTVQNGGNTITNTKVGQWDTAYGWGNHASSGYLTSFDITTQTDSKYLRSNADDTSSGSLTVVSYKFNGNATDPTDTTATIYDQFGQGPTISGLAVCFRTGSTPAQTAKLNSSGTFTVSGDIVAYGSPSDIRLKENIKPIESALDKVSKLQGVTFDWKEKSENILDIKEDIGFVAQDVQKVLPELVRENDNGMLSMRHQGITPILLEAIKELKAEIEELKKQIK